MGVKYWVRVSWWSVLLLEATGVTVENHRPVACHWQTLSHNVVSSTPRHKWDSNSQRYSGDWRRPRRPQTNWLYNIQLYRVVVILLAGSQSTFYSPIYWLFEGGYCPIDILLSKGTSDKKLYPVHITTDEYPTQSFS